MDIQNTLAFLENATFTPYRHKTHYQEQLELERENLPLIDVEEIEIEAELFFQLFKSLVF